MSAKKKKNEAKVKQGRANRNKGNRAERLLVEYLKEKGWDAYRVPLSGAAKGFKGDVVATKDTTINFEVKNQTHLKKVFELYDEHSSQTKESSLSFVWPEEDNLCIVASYNLDTVLRSASYYGFPERNPLYEKYSRTFKKVASLKKLLGGADILALKVDRKPFLFIRYQ